MLGNVHEWCEDRALNYQPNESGVLFDEIHKLENVQNDVSRLIRGGSFTDRPDASRSSHRRKHGATDRYMTNGFRLARTIP